MISMIACVGKNLELGRGGDLVFHFKEDMKFFKETTMGHPVLMGSKTFFSLPKILPERTNYVLTQHPEALPEGVVAVTNLERFLAEHEDENVFVIGGAYVYNELLPYANELYLTEVDAAAEADVYFPKFNHENYDKIILKEGAQDGINYTFAKYTKK